MTEIVTDVYEEAVVETAPAQAADAPDQETAVPFAPGDATPDEAEPVATVARPKSDKRPSAPRRPKATKEMFSVCVDGGDGKAAWFNISHEMGKQMSFSKPMFTCAMRVVPEEVAFSLLQVTNKMRASVVETPITMPRGPMGVLARTRATLEAAGQLPQDAQVVVSVDDRTAVYDLARDEHGIATLTGGDADEIEVPRGATRALVFMRAPRLGRLLSVYGIVYPGRAGTPTSLRRVAAEVLNVMSGVPEFRLLAGITAASVPAAPTSRAAARPVKPAMRVGVMLPVRLFAPDEDPAPVGAGHVAIEVDLEKADPAGGNVLYSISSSEPLTDEVLEPFKAKLIEGLNWHLRTALGDEELTSISYEIVLGEVDHGTAERLQTALLSLPGLDLTPRRYLPMNAPPA